MQTNFERTTVSRRLGFGLGISIFKMIARSSYTVLLVPLFLRAWGPDTYGRWLALTAILAYITLLNFGGQSYIGNLLTLDVAHKDTEGYKRHLSEAMSFFILMSVVVLCGLGLLMMLPQLRLPGIQGVLTLSDRLGLFFIGGNLVLAITTGGYITNYQSHGMWNRSNVVYTLVEFISVAIRASVLLLALPPAVFAAVYFIVHCVHILIMVWDVRRTVPLARSFTFSFQAARQGIRHLRGSMFFWLITFALAINDQGVVLVASEGLGAVAISLFVTHRIVANFLTYPMNIVRGPLQPELTRLAGQGRIAELQRVMLFSVRLMSLISLGMAIGIYVWIPTIYPLWTDNTLDLMSGLLLIMLGQMVLRAGWQTAGWGNLAANAHRGVASAQFVNAILTVLLALLFLPIYGLVGVALASLLGDIACSLTMYPFFASRLTKVSSVRIYGAMLRSWLAAIPLIVVIAISRTLFDDDVSWRFAATLIGFVFLYPTFLLSLGSRETHRVLYAVASRLKLLAKRKQK